MCFAPQRRALFRHRILQKWSDPLVFCSFFSWKCASRHNGVHFFDILTSKSGPMLRCYIYFDLEMYFAPQRRALFRRRHFQKWSENDVFCTFLLGNVLRATMAYNFSSFLWSGGSAPAALTSLLFEPPEPQIISYLFAYLYLLSFYSFFSDLSLLYASSLLCFSSLHIVGNLTSKFPSIKGKPPKPFSLKLHYLFALRNYFSQKNPQVNGYVQISANLFGCRTNAKCVETSRLFPEGVWAQGSSNSGEFLKHLLIFTYFHSCSSSHSHILTSFHLHIFTSSLSSHLYILASLYPLSFTSSHLHSCSSSHLLTSHPHIFLSLHSLIFTSSHLHILSSSSSHPHIFSSSHLLTSHPHISSSPLVFLPSCPRLLFFSLLKAEAGGSANETACPSRPQPFRMKWGSIA